MNIKKKGLGRGLSDLGLGELLSSVKQPLDIKESKIEQAHKISSTKANNANEADTASIPTTGLRKLAIDMLRPNRYQPRQDFEPHSLNELAESIKTQGIIQPLLVRPLSAKTNFKGQTMEFEIIAGERRWRAAQIAGLSEIPVISRELSDEQSAAIALIENLQREDLNAIDTAQGLQRLISEFGMTHQAVAESIGKSRVTVTNLLRLLNLPDAVKHMVQKGDLEMGHARALLALPSYQQLQIANIIVNKNLSVRAAEELINKKQLPSTTTTEKNKPDPNIIQLQKKLQSVLGSKIKIQHSKKGKGKLVIHYSNLDELDNILLHIK